MDDRGDQEGEADDLEPDLDGGEDQGPTAAELLMGAFSQLVAGEDDRRRGNGPDHPSDP